jgi:hypothetical protein
MKALIAALALLTVCSAAYAQTKKGTNRLTISFVQKCYLNKLNVDKGGEAPDPIITRNTWAPAVGLEYERTTSYGLIYAIGVDYGVQPHDITLHYDFTDYDPAAKKNLAGYTFESEVKVKTRYFAPRIMVGYSYRILNNLSLIGKVGLDWGYYLDEYSAHDQATNITYATDDSTELRLSNVANSTVHLGDNSDKSGSGRRFSNKISSLDLYLGVSKDMHLKYLHSLAIGVSATRCMIKEPGQFAIEGHKSHWGDITTEYDYYWNRNISLGIRVTTGLWK